jgi:hypothetical protein
LGDAQLKSCFSKLDSNVQNEDSKLRRKCFWLEKRTWGIRKRSAFLTTQTIPKQFSALSNSQWTGAMKTYWLRTWACNRDDLLEVAENVLPFDLKEETSYPIRKNVWLS